VFAADCAQWFFMMRNMERMAMLSDLFKFMASKSLVRKLLVCVVLVSALAGCVTPKKARHAPRKPSARPQTRPVDAKAQQHYYDLGLQQYSKEDYDDAEESFEQAVAYGPNTPLGQKAKENLKKVQKILKTLEEIESK
jgi:Tfp pilus assembly protein PilF